MLFCSHRELQSYYHDDSIVLCH